MTRWRGVAAATCATLLLVAPAVANADRPGFLPTWQPGSKVLILPGTGDPAGEDQVGRTVDVGWFDDENGNRLPYQVVPYPAAFGARAFGVLIPIVGKGTYNESAAIGTANMVAAAQNTPGKVILDGFSQSASPVMSAAYLLHTLHVKDDSDVQVVVAADPRFPHTGAEVQMPSFITGLYTNGERDPYDTGDIGVTSICIIGDTTCGMANPLARPISFLVYFLPGFYIHANMYDDAGKFAVVSEQTVGNTKYVILDGGNPYGMMLRDLGIQVPKEFDEVMNTLVPRQMPGQASTLFGHEVPTPREVQVALYHALGLKVPVTDPDVVNKPGNVSAGGANVATVPVPSGAPQVTSAQVSAPPVLAPAPAPPASAPETVSVPDRPSVGRTEWLTPTPAAPAITSPLSPVPGSVTPSAPVPASPPAPLLPNPPSQGEMSFPQVVPPTGMSGIGPSAPLDTPNLQPAPGAGPVSAGQ